MSSVRQHDHDKGYQNANPINVPHHLMLPLGLGSINDSNYFHSWAVLELYQGTMYETPGGNKRRKKMMMKERKEMKDSSLQLRPD